MPSSGGASPSASSTELGRQGPFAATTDASAADAAQDAMWEKKSAAQIQKEKEERARWADVESDGEEVIVFHGEHRNAGRAEGEVWATVGKKAKNGKTRSVPAPPPPRPSEFPRKQPEDTAKAASAPYRPPKGPARQAAVRAEHYDSSNGYRWETSSWGSLGRGGDTWSSSKASSGRGGDSWSSATRGGSTWDEGSWGQKSEARAPKADFCRGRGKEKNESFKRGPQVAVNMDSSRLAW